MMTNQMAKHYQQNNQCDVPTQLAYHQRIDKNNSTVDAKEEKKVTENENRRTLLSTLDARFMREKNKQIN